jgi:hypothetical protein
MEMRKVATDSSTMPEPADGVVEVPRGEMTHHPAFFAGL